MRSQVNPEASKSGGGHRIPGEAPLIQVAQIAEQELRSSKRVETKDAARPGFLDQNMGRGNTGAVMLGCQIAQVGVVSENGK